MLERYYEISQVSKHRITSVSKRYKYVRKAHHLRVGFAIGIVSNALQELRLLVPRLEQSSAFLLPADRGVTVLHLVSDVIQSNLKWRINPNSPAKIQTIFDICKYKNKIYQNSQKLILRPLFLFRNFS